MVSRLIDSKVTVCHGPNDYRELYAPKRVGRNRRAVKRHNAHPHIGWLAVLAVVLFVAAEGVLK